MFDSLKLAIVDVETTGGSALFNRIIEIGILRIENGSVTQTFETLVNPECRIPPMIESLTGITDQDVEGAPNFRSIAARVRELLDGAVFVAHNARFDAAFVRNEFERIGEPWSAACLCTVRLSRRLYPGFRHHGLSSLIERFGFACDRRHRALDDARVVWLFLEHARRDVPEERLNRSLKALLKTPSLPPNLPAGALDKLPTGPGVYIFKDSVGQALYIGKSLTVRSRVLSHFSSDHSSGKEMRLCQQTARIEAHPTYGELGALFLESHLVKQMLPLYNRHLRYARRLTVIRPSTPQNGFHTVQVATLAPDAGVELGEVLGIFRSARQAKDFLAEAAKASQLCPKLLGLESGKGACFAYALKRCKGACIGGEKPVAYNFRLEEVFRNRRLRVWPYSGPVLIEEKQTDASAGHLFIVDQWNLMHAFNYSEDGLSRFLPQAHGFDYDAYRILVRYLFAKPRTVKPLSTTELKRLLAQAGVLPAADEETHFWEHAMPTQSDSALPVWSATEASA